MAIKLNKKSFEYAKKLIDEGKFVFDEKDAWSEHKPSTQKENEFIDQHGFDDYAKWYLGVDEDKNENTKERYEFPYGDFKKVHRGGVIAAEARAGQYKHFDIEKAASQLLDMINKTKK